MNSDNVIIASRILVRAVGEALKATGGDGLAVATAAGALFCRCVEVMGEAGYGRMYLDAVIHTLKEGGGHGERAGEREESHHYC